MLTHAPNDHLHQTVGPEAMEAAMTEEDFLQEKGEGEMMDRRRRVTSTGLEGTPPPTGTVVAMAMTTRDKRVADPPCQDATLTKKE